MSLKDKVRELHATGMSQRQIANKLGCAKSTVHHHLHVEARRKSLSRQRKARKGMRVWVKELKESTPCTDCGQFFPHYVMDFDHVRGTKIENVSKLYRGLGGKKKIIEEIEKCEIVCSNCHRIRTHERSVRKTA